VVGCTAPHSGAPAPHPLTGESKKCGEFTSGFECGDTDGPVLKSEPSRDVCGLDSDIGKRYLAGVLDCQLDVLVQ